MDRPEALIDFTRQISLDWINQYAREIASTSTYQQETRTIGPDLSI